MKAYYEDEWVTIYHGDCREILPSLPKVDLVLTDPPYGLGDKLQGGNWGRRVGAAAVWDRLYEGIESVVDAGRNSIIWAVITTIYL